MKLLKSSWLLFLCHQGPKAGGFSSVGQNNHPYNRDMFLQANNSPDENSINARRQFMNVAAMMTLAAATPAPALAYFIMDDETGDYIEKQDEDWQTAWKKRADKASTMTSEEIFQAARGAGNLDLKDGQAESEASKKRRAMSACRDTSVRNKTGAGSEKECTARVFAGDYNFLL